MLWLPKVLMPDRLVMLSSIAIRLAGGIKFNKRLSHFAHGRLGINKARIGCYLAYLRLNAFVISRLYIALFLQQLEKLWHMNKPLKVIYTHEIIDRNE